MNAPDVDSRSQVPCWLSISTQSNPWRASSSTIFGLPSVLPTPRATSPRRSFAFTGLVNESMRAMASYSRQTCECVELRRRAAAEVDLVTAGADERAPGRHPLLDLLHAASGYAGGLPVPLTGRDHFVDRRVMLGRIARVPQGVGQVSRPEPAGVDALHRHDLVRIVDGRARFELDRHENLVVGPLAIARAVDARAAHSRPTGRRWADSGWRGPPAPLPRGSPPSARSRPVRPRPAVGQWRSSRLSGARTTAVDPPARTPIMARADDCRSHIPCWLSIRTQSKPAPASTSAI